MSSSVDEMTERLLADAGIEPGMRVLDIGCGPGATQGSFALAIDSALTCLPVPQLI